MTENAARRVEDGAVASLNIANRAALMGNEATLNISAADK